MERIKLMEFMLVLKKKWWIITVITAVSLIFSGIISLWILEPQYQAYTTLMVGKPQNTLEAIAYEDLLLNEKLVATYAEIIKSRTILTTVIEDLNLSIGYEELKRMIEIKTLKDTEIIKVEIIYHNALFASKIANEIVKVFTKQASEFMKTDNILVIDKALTPTRPIKPSPILNMTFSGIVGLGIGILLIYLVEVMDNTVKTQYDIEKYIELPVIAVIPQFNK